jgi:hypothetical protein
MRLLKADASKESLFKSINSNYFTSNKKIHNPNLGLTTISPKWKNVNMEKPELKKVCAAKVFSAACMLIRREVLQESF